MKQIKCIFFIGLIFIVHSDPLSCMEINRLIHTENKEVAQSIPKNEKQKQRNWSVDLLTQPIRVSFKKKKYDYGSLGKLAKSGQVGDPKKDMWGMIAQAKGHKPKEKVSPTIYTGPKKKNNLPLAQKTVQSKRFYASLPANKVRSELLTFQETVNSSEAAQMAGLLLSLANQ